MCIVVFIFIILAVFILTPTLESLTGMDHLKGKWVNLQGEHRAKMWDNDQSEKRFMVKKDNQIPPIIIRKGTEDKVDFERAETPSDNFGGEKPVYVSLPKKAPVNAANNFAKQISNTITAGADSYGFVKLTKKPIKGETYTPTAAIIGFDESAIIRKKTNIPENIKREWDAEVYVKNKRKPAGEDAWK